MYHRRLEFSVIAERLAAFEEAMTTLGELRKKQDGFLGQALLQSYGYPGKYAVTLCWETWEAADAFARSKAFRDLLEANPREGRGFAQSRPTEAYESVLDINADGFSGATAGEYQCVVLADWVIDRGPAKEPHNSCAASQSSASCARSTCKGLDPVASACHWAPHSGTSPSPSARTWTRPSRHGSQRSCRGSPPTTPSPRSRAWHRSWTLIASSIA